MLICSKMKNTVMTVALAFAMIPSVASACNPVNPICLFKQLLKTTPGLPVVDPVSIPAIIPHVPAALLKEGQEKAKELIDKQLQQTRSVDKPADVKMDKMPSTNEVALAQGQEFAALEGFPAFDSEDPMEIAKAIEVLYLRPGWQEGDKSPLTTYDQSLMAYYRQQFQLNNIVEAVGTYAVLESKITALMATAENVQKKLDEADDLNKAQRANFEAQLLEYQLQIVYNQLLAAQLQMTSVSQLSAMRPILDAPVLGKM